MDNEFIFHNVGQGLFYSGRIRNFNFVYDCGSLKKIPIGAIQNYKNSLAEKNNDKLDLLIISHFHEDHINGLVELLKGIKVDTVIIPYYKPVERLEIALNIYNNAKNKDIDNILDFLSDPALFLIQHNSKKIIFILSGEGEEGRFPNIEENTDEMKINLGIVEEQDQKPIRDEENYENADRIKFYKHTGYLVRSRWLFRFFCHTYNKKKEIINFESEIDNIIRDNLKKKNYSYNPIKEAIKDKECLNRIKKKYKKLFDDLNFTCLVLYHGPFQKYDIGSNPNTSISNIYCSNCHNKYTLYNCFIHKIHIEGTNSNNIYFGHKIDNSCLFNPIQNNAIEEIAIQSLRNEKNYPMGQFLLSDANLANKDFFPNFKKHFSNYFMYALLSLIPHHGSKKSWNNLLIDKMHNCHFWIPSYGRNNSYHHPSGKVICDIINNNRLILPCNEDVKIKLSFNYGYE